MEASAPVRAILELGETIGLTIEKVEVIETTKRVTEWSGPGQASKGATGVGSEDSRVTIFHFTNGTRCEIY